MLAHQIAERFEEWLAEQNFQPSIHRSWSLDEALLSWLRDEATYWTAENYELYLRTIVIIVANWVANKKNFTYQLNGKELVLKRLYGQYIAASPWDCLQRDFYERAAFIWREAHPARVRAPEDPPSPPA